MPSEAYVREIQARAEGRFEVQSSGPFIDEMLEGASRHLEDCSAVRLRRRGRKRAGWHTFLIAAVPGKEELRSAIQWASEVRDALLEPETADLWLLMIDSGLVPSTGLRVETDELFCRKLVQRPDESLNDLLDRTFLARLQAKGQETALEDPLSAAFAKTARAHPWMSGEVVGAWRTALLSGQTGASLAEALPGAPLSIEVQE